MSTNTKWLVGGLTVIALFCGCNQGNETPKKVAEIEKQIADAQKPIQPKNAVPVDPLVELECPEFHAVADGTLYAEKWDNGTQFYWLVGTKAVHVALDDFKKEDFPSSYADSKGGLYVRGHTHLWYLKDGIATQVRVVSPGEVTPEEYRRTAATAFWSVLKEYGKTAYEAGKEAGYDRGYDAGKEAARDAN